VKITAIVSGGMDSATLAYHLIELEHDVELVSFDYGQRHRVELEHAEALSDRLDVPWSLVDLSGLRSLIGGSALTDDTIDVPEGHYAEPSMAKTVVPNRNLIMLSIAAGIAVANDSDRVATGVHAGDHFVYPDCRPTFISAASTAIMLGTDGFAPPGFGVIAPFVHISKADIARIGDELGVPWDETWSCYKGGARHCGLCGTCVERIEAFQIAGVDDPTEYDAMPDLAGLVSTFERIEVDG